ncbi:serpin family protein [Streptomyces sp. ST1015]|uniref:serpin family protein n=1 Tax=Streptomyces sp. ST1015 TaxID=1848900 RepID=UPI001CA6ED07|nr:serpin family protein [Streptomyces sp. ST1015]QZZ29989.1 proteinase inhibitor I4 serpin [Streptomyces sp. ST1015]
MRTAVQAVNALTSRWAGAVDVSHGTAFSAAGVWPLLAFLADGADGAARAELSAAVGVPASRSASLARELLAGLADVAGLDGAVGVWARRTLELRESWGEGLTRGVLTGDLDADRAALDAWARERTGGRIPSMPVALDRGTEFVLASALALRTRWVERFQETFLDSPHWTDRAYLGLRRVTGSPDELVVACTPFGYVTEVRVLGTESLDVHLLLGEPELSASRVLRAGVGLLAGEHAVVPGSRLPLGDAGPGVRVRETPSAEEKPVELRVLTAPFALAARHDLLDRAELFGLKAARDRSRGHFPGVSDRPLAVSSAEQSAVARFGAEGFEAAAVTLVAAAAGGVPEFRWTTRTVEARFDRPFGFLAVHRGTGLVLMAGWVAEPSDWHAS